MEKQEETKLQIQGKQQKPDNKGKVDELQLLMKRYDDEGITLVEGIAMSGVGVLVITTKIFKESLGGGSTSSSTFIPKVEIVKDGEDKILYGAGMTRIVRQEVKNG
jgi:hypothetical protein